jgi:hypothetical protein
MAAYNEMIAVTSVVLPVVENEQQGFDLPQLLNQAMQKLKWQRNSPVVLADCSAC